MYLFNEVFDLKPTSAAARAGNAAGATSVGPYPLRAQAPYERHVALPQFGLATDEHIYTDEGGAYIAGFLFFSRKFRPSRDAL